MHIVDAEWIERCKERPDKFKIMVDNDSIWVEEIGSGDIMHYFLEYGYEFAKTLLEYIECNVEVV